MINTTKASNFWELIFTFFSFVHQKEATSVRKPEKKRRDSWRFSAWGQNSSFWGRRETRKRCRHLWSSTQQRTRFMCWRVCLLVKDYMSTTWQVLDADFVISKVVLERTSYSVRMNEKGKTNAENFVKSKRVFWRPFEKFREIVSQLFSRRASIHESISC